MNDSRDVTTGSSGEIRSFSLGGGSSPIRKVKAIIPQVKNKTVVEQIEKLLLVIDTKINDRPDLRNTPALIPNIEENGAVSIDWIFSDFRIGVNLEVNPADSGWHLLTNEKLGDVTASGQLKNMDATISDFLDYITKNT
jgi:hypothetical protein